MRASRKGGIVNTLKRVLIAAGALFALVLGGGAHWRW
jgi:hypothetical protein